MTGEDRGAAAGETYGETYWGGYVGAHPYPDASSRWRELASAYQGAVEAGAQAVAARVRGECCSDCGQRGGPYCDDGRHPDGCRCQFCREDEREAQARDDDFETREEAEFLRDAASLDTAFEEDL